MKNNINLINIDNLTIGMEYKLPVLFELLKIEYTNDTRGRKRKLDDIKQYLIIEDMPKKIYKYLGVKEEFEKKEDNRGKSENSRGNGKGNGKYIKLVKPILQKYLNYVYQENKNKEIFTTNKTLAKYCGFLTDDFINAGEEKNLFSKFLKNDKGLMNTIAFYETFKFADSSYKGVINGAFSSLSEINDGLIFEYNYIINWKYLGGEYCRMVNEKEIGIIKGLQNEILEEMELTKIGEVNCSERLSKVFYEKFNNEIINRIEECDKVFSGYKIVISKPFEDVKDYESKKDLNQLYCKEIENNQQKKVDKFKSELKEKYADWWGEVPLKTGKEKALTDINYMNDVRLVIDLLLNSNTKGCLFEFNNIKKKIQQNNNENINDAKELIKLGVVNIMDLPY